MIQAAVAYSFALKDGEGFRKVWEEFNTRIDSLIEKLRGLKGWQKSKNAEISQLKNRMETMVVQYNNQKEFNRLFTKMVNKTLEDEVMPNLNSVLSDIVRRLHIFTFRLETPNSIALSLFSFHSQLMIQKSPSCAPVALVYDDLVTSFCFEFLDNFNTYWFFLLLSLGLHMLVLGFAIALADLLRKFYAYDEVLTEDMYVAKANLSSSASTTLIPSMLSSVMDDAKPYDGYSDNHLKEGYHAGKT